MAGAPMKYTIEIARRTQANDKTTALAPPRTYDRNSMDETKPSACVPTNFTGQMKATQSPFLI